VEVWLNQTSEGQPQPPLFRSRISIIIITTTSAKRHETDLTILQCKSLGAK
jgi:hypothetical protein